MKIIETRDTALLATLNYDVQEIHHKIDPNIFKPHTHENMKSVFDDMLDHDNIKMFVAYLDEIAAGYMVLTRLDRRENGFMYAYAVIHIDQMCVEKAFKGRGIGKALVEYAKKYASSLNINRVEMNYWTQNMNSGEFFRSQGFENYNERLALIL